MYLLQWIKGQNTTKLIQKKGQVNYLLCWMGKQHYYEIESERTEKFFLESKKVKMNKLGISKEN